MFNLKKNRKGFTLVELMVVVVIIGILTAIAIPVYSAVTASAEAKSCIANQRTIAGAIQMYYAEHEEYPANMAALGAYLEQDPENFACPSDEEAVYSFTVTNGNISVGCPAENPKHVVAGIEAD